MKIGVFALQGAFREHCRMLEMLGAECVEIRRKSSFLRDLGGIILPGGESTVQGKLMREEGLIEPVRDAIGEGMPVFGTCAGLILLAKKISNDDRSYIGSLDATVRRNAYGRQTGSFKAELDFDGVGRYPAVFIRGPVVDSVGSGVNVLAKAGDDIVAVRQKNILGLSFHPELTDDVRIHEYFLKMI